MRAFSILLIAALALGTLSQEKCKEGRGGYSLNPLKAGGSAYPDSTTVSVMLFSNSAPLAKGTVPQTLTESLRDAIQRQTKMDLLVRNGDIVFEGNITGYTITPVSIQSGSDVAALNRLTITVAVKFTDTKNEKNSFDQSFSRFADYNSSQNLPSVEDELIKEITDQLVQDILNRSINNW